MRQGIISILEYYGGQYWPNQEIIFRQPYHPWGLAYSFNFTKGIFTPFSTCTIVIYNPSPEITDSLKFDPNNPFNRPKIEIRGGESESRLLSYTPGTPAAQGELAPLKSELPLLYTGYPFFFSEDKQIGGKTLTIQCSDMSQDVATIRINDQFISGTPVLSILQKLFPDADLTEVASGLSGVVTENPVYYNNLLLHSQVLPELARIYKFRYYFTQGGIVKFTMSGIPQDGNKTTIVNNTTGLIEYPVSINWCFWNIKTFFGRPVVFYPGQWMTVDLTNLKGSQVLFSNTGGVTEFFGKKSGLVVEAKYNWQDESAEIQYTISPDGYPVETSPIQAL